MDEPRDHVIREPLPWREEQLTECGRELSDVASAITSDQLRKRLKDYGQQRTVFTVCMTCYHHVYEGWDVDPVGMISREGHRTGVPMRYRIVVSPVKKPPLNNQRLIHELHAIAKLVETHRDEFDQLIQEQKVGAEWRDRLAKRRKN